MRRIFSIGPLAALLLAGCVWDGEPEDGEPQTGHADMVRIPAKGKGFLQGSEGALANVNEYPAFSNRFTYDFRLDPTEVTQGQYAKLMGRNPVPDSSRYGAGAGYPVYNVSWFDAALFCNARSKAAGLDTVYRYDRLDKADSGSVYSLSGLQIDLGKAGYRLPTEAEWEFAAHAGTEAEFPWGTLGDSTRARESAWYLDNAGGKTHPVAKLKPNAFGLYDMAGNVMEWVNDWKGPYPKAGSEDFAGSRDPGPESDTPIKGGAFKYGMRELRPSNRSATYTTIRSATAEYVGFRCALGAIAHPKFSAADGNLATTDPVRLEIPRIQNLVGGRSAKLVFVNANEAVRHLVYVDYGRMPPRLTEFGDIGNVFYPSVSPNGSWAAFGTGLEGSASGSSIYVRRLGDSATPARLIGPGFIPRWWVDPATRDTFLVYASSASDNSQAQWRASQTLIQKMAAGAPIGAPAILVDAGGFHDGRSQDGRWLATGFRMLKMRDGASGEARVLFTAPQNGKAEGDTSQVCNVSMAPDSTGRVLFLDFGYDRISKVTGSFYDIHQIAFMSDPQGKVLRWFRAPQGEKGWEDLEWSNRADFAVSASTDAAGGHHRLYLLDLKDSASTLLASGGTLATPGLWLGEAPEDIPHEGLDLDSLGAYNDPATDDYQSVFASRMRMFWKRHQGLELIFTGSSHVFAKIDPSRITRFKAVNMGYPANGWQGQEEWVVNYALNHCPNLKVLVMEALPGWLKYPGSDYTWASRISQTKGVKYDRSRGFWKAGLPPRFEDLIKQSATSNWWDQDSLGFHFEEAHGWGGELIKPLDSDWGLDNPEYLANMKRIEELARLLSSRKIHLVLVNYPTDPAYKGTEYYGPYGPRLSVAQGIIKRYKEMESISPYVHFYDAYNFGDHDYTDAEAGNATHLSAAGGIKITVRLDSLVNTFPEAKGRGGE
jgi:uncharacterized protein (TIGR02171 family)